MAMTVRRLAAISTLRLTLVAGRDGIDRTITWAHAIELEDPTPFLAGGELVMTTGMNVGASADQQFRYLQRLSAAGVAALAFDTGTTHAQVPPGVLAAGDELGLPVLAVPADTPFIALSRAIIDEVTADQVRSVQRVVDQQDVLARETLRNGIPAVVSALTRLLSATVTVLDGTGNALAADGPESAHVCELGTSLIGADGSSRTRRSSQVVADGDGYCTVQTLRAARPHSGYLVIKTSGPLSVSERLLVSHAVSLISIEFGKPAKVRDAEHRLRAAVTASLLSAPAVIDEALLRYFGFSPDNAVVVIAVTGTGPSIAAERHAHEVLETQRVPYLVGARQDELVLVLNAADQAVAESFSVSLGELIGRPARAGRSAPANIAAIPCAVEQARVAATVGTDTKLQNYSEIELFGTILGARPDHELQLIAEPLAPLIHHDTESGSAADGLVATLAGYLRHNGHLENAAADLGVHRHTMRNRITKIASLTQKNLQSADTRAELLLALRARELQTIRRTQA